MKTLVSKILTICGFMLVGPCLAEDAGTVEALVHDALAGALAENPERVTSVRSVLEEDQFEHAEGWSGVLDDVAALEILTASTTRKEKAEALKKHAKTINDPVARERIYALAERSEAYRLDELVRKRRLNRVSRVVNRTFRTASQVLAGQPRALGVAGVDTFFALTGKNGPNTVEKKIAYLAKLEETQDEASPEEIAAIRKILDKVEKKRSRALQADWRKRVENAQAGNRPRSAKRLCEVGVSLWPDEEWFGTRLKEIDAELVRSEESRPPTPFLEPTDVDFAKADLIRGQLAEGVEQTPFVSDAPSRRQIGDAISARRTRTLDYLLFGNTGPIDARRTARTAVAEGANAPTTLGLTHVAETVARGISLIWVNELGIEEALDTYAYVERADPGSITEKDRRRWADLAAKGKRYPQAIDVLERGGIEDPKRVRKYREKWGKDIIGRCEKLPPGTDRFAALTFVIEELEAPSAAKRAKKILAKTPATDRPLVLVETGDLREHERILMESGLEFERAWWDGDGSNGEVWKETCYWDPEGAVWYRAARNSPWRRSPQPADRLEKLNAAFARIEQSIVARSLEDKRRGKPLLPIEIEGGIGASTFLTPKVVEWDLTEDDDHLFE